MSKDRTRETDWRRERRAARMHRRAERSVALAASPEDLTRALSRRRHALRVGGNPSREVAR